MLQMHCTSAIGFLRTASSQRAHQKLASILLVRDSSDSLLTTYLRPLCPMRQPRTEKQRREQYGDAKDTFAAAVSFVNRHQVSVRESGARIQHLCRRQEGLYCLREPGTRRVE
jgi:hypothetical protein